MFVVDTNVLVYAADADSPAHPACFKRLEGWRRGAGAWYGTWGIVYEFLRVVTHPRVFHPPTPMETAWAAVEALTGARSVVMLAETERHREILDDVLRGSGALGNVVHDAHIVALLREHGVGEIVTADEDFRRFPGLRVTNPFR